jgi:hypothetical protein
MDMEVQIGGFGRIETIQGPPGTFEKHYYYEEYGYGILQARSSGNSALRLVVFSIGPFTSEAEKSPMLLVSCCRFVALLGSNGTIALETY